MSYTIIVNGRVEHVPRNGIVKVQLVYPKGRIVVDVRPEDTGIRAGRYHPVNPQRRTQALAYRE